MPQTVYINGKFFAQSITGVQRFARELVVEVDRLLASGRWTTEIPFELIVPSGHLNAVPSLSRIKVTELLATRLHVWEQVLLPSRSRNGLLINLAGSAPMFKRGQICTFHDAAVFDIPEAYSTLFARWYRFLFVLQGRLSRRVLTVSKFSRERLSHHLRIPASSIGVVSNGASHVDRIQSDDTVLKHFNLQHGRYLLAVGSNNPSKNFAALLRAFSDVSSTDAQLVVVGGKNGAVFASAGSDLLFVDDRRIIRTGRVDDAQLKSLYTHARAFVFPSIYEGFGIPPIEAMAADCPVLAGRAASIPEVCGDAVGYFDPRDISSITAVLERAIADDAWLQCLRVAGRERASRFTWTSAAEALMTELVNVGVVHASPPDQETRISRGPL